MKANIVDKLLETDNYLIEQILKYNNRVAAETLVERHYKTIYKDIVYKVNDEELAKDLTQETFISVLRGLGQFNCDKSGFKTWVLTIAKNKVIDYSRSRHFHEMSVTESTDDTEKYFEDYTVSEQNIENEVINYMATKQIAIKLRDEDEITRTIFEMRARDEYTFAEIADRLDINVSLAKNRYYALIKRLRKEMAEYE